MAKTCSVAPPFNPPVQFELAVCAVNAAVGRLAIQAKIGIGEWRADVQARNWAGHAVAEVLELDITDEKAKATIKSLLKTWIKNGALRIERKTDAKRRDVREFVVAGL